jgi:dTDP-glucose 4,6-dehydratase
LNILITGGAGFVCSHLADTLFEKNHDLILLDNLLTGNKNNIEHLLDHKNVKFIQHDVQDHIDISEEIDFIFHFASAASPIAYQENPVNTLKAGSIGTINTLGLAKVKNADYLLASTSEIYGDPKVSPQSEEYWGNVNPSGERSMYDEAKRFAEAATATYSRTYNLKTKVVRIFNTYGPRMKLNDGRVVTNFIVQALKGQDITVYGDGTQTRSFSYVQDTVSGIVSLMESNHNDVFNIGNPTEITINELASKIIEITNSNSSLINKDLPQDDPKQRKPDITKARTMLNWEPKVNLEDGLTKTIDWVSSQL